MICSNRKPLTLTLLAAYACVSIASAQRAGGGGGIYRDAPTVVIRGQGAVSGAEVLLNKIGHRVWQYLGIPFAKPPLGDLRFAPPDADPPPAWTGVRNGSAHVPGCIQDLPTRLPPVHKLFASTTSGQSEDCLYLNVYRPEGECKLKLFWPKRAISPRTLLRKRLQLLQVQLSKKKKRKEENGKLRLYIGK